MAILQKEIQKQVQKEKALREISFESIECLQVWRSPEVVGSPFQIRAATTGNDQIPTDKRE